MLFLLKSIFTVVKIVLSKPDLRVIVEEAVIVFQSTHYFFFPALPFHLHPGRTQLLNIFTSYAVQFGLVLLAVQELVYLVSLNLNVFNLCGSLISRLWNLDLFERNFTVFKYGACEIDFGSMVRLVGVSGHWSWL